MPASAPPRHSWSVADRPTDENMVRNNGSVPTETIVTFITPPGAPIRDDAPPPGCNP